MDQAVRPPETDRSSSGHARNARKLVLTACVLGIAALIIVAKVAYTHHRDATALAAAADAQAIIPVSTVKPKPLSDSSELVLPGNLQANYEAPIYARTSGYLRRWMVDIGTPVKAGQLLAEIESPEVDSQLRQAQADLSTALANQKIATVTAERWRNLRASDSVSKQEADEKISQAASNDAQVQAARANVQRLRELSGFERIIAPFDGVVTARNTDIGQLIAAGNNTGNALFRVADESRLRLYVRVPQTYAAALHDGLKAKLVVPDRPGKNYTATFESTSEAIDMTSRTLLVQLSVDNTQKELFPGAYTEVHFDMPAGINGTAFKLPGNVLLFRGDGLQVATVDANGHVTLKQVTIGRDEGATIEIVHGLNASDNVVVSPPDSLISGQQVRVVSNAAPKAKQVEKS